jgi:nicotinamidase-related amidase
VTTLRPGPDSGALEGLQARRAALLVIDVQERLCAAMPPDAVERVVKGTSILLEVARRFGLPIVVTEQYPKGLGPTVAPLAQAIAAIAAEQPALVHRFEKLEFSAAATPELAALWPKLGRDQWLLAGMETHVCVLQTARDLRRRGAAVHLVTDAVSSRTKANFRVGMAQLRGLGVVESSVETAMFDLLGRAGGDDFKALSKLIR